MLFFLSLPPSAGRCWWCCRSWRETLASPSPTVWLTVKRPRPLLETGPPPRLPTVHSSPLILMACTGQGRYDHRLLSPAQTLPFCQTTGKSGNPRAALRNKDANSSYPPSSPAPYTSSAGLCSLPCQTDVPCQEWNKGRGPVFHGQIFFCTGAVYGTGIALPIFPYAWKQSGVWVERRNYWAIFQPVSQSRAAFRQ